MSVCDSTGSRSYLWLFWGSLEMSETLRRCCRVLYQSDLWESASQRGKRKEPLQKFNQSMSIWNFFPPSPQLHQPSMTTDACPPQEWPYLQAEGQNHVWLGQCVFVLLAHVNDRSVVSPFQLLDFELSALGHRHALQVGHQLIDGGLELLDKHGFHVFGHKLGELTSLFGIEKTCDYMAADLMRIYCN